MALVLGNTVISPNLRGRPWVYNTSPVVVQTPVYQGVQPIVNTIPVPFVGERQITEFEFVGGTWRKYGMPVPAVVGKTAEGYGVFVGYHATIPGVFAFVKINPFVYTRLEDVDRLPKITVTQSGFYGRRGAGAGVKTHGWMVWHYDRIRKVITFYVPSLAPNAVLFTVPMAELMSRHAFILRSNPAAYKSVRLFARRFGVAPLLRLRMGAATPQQAVVPYTYEQRRLLQSAITGAVIRDLKEEGIELDEDETRRLRSGVIKKIRKNSQPAPGETQEQYEKRLAHVGSQHGAKVKHHHHKHKQPSGKTSLSPHEAEKLLHEHAYTSDRQRRFFGSVANKNE